MNTVEQNTYQDAVIYARYSSHSQRDVSIEQQIRACRLFAERQGLRIVEIYEDRALTGTNDKRPGFQKMIRDAKTATWEYVIVYTLDRFARDRYDSAVYKRELKEQGVKVLSAMENISDDPTGVLMESLLEGLAEYYSKELSRKIRRGMEDNAGKCMVNGGVPLGYTRGPDGRYAIVEHEASYVREIFRRIKDGDSFREIIENFNARGIRTKTGKEWNSSSFNRIITNERYTGVYIYHDIRIPGGIPQIIPKDLFDTVQVLLHSKPNCRADRTGTTPQRRRRDNGIYLLTGKLYCGDCKSPMVGLSGTSKTSSLHFYYTCKGKRTEHKDCHRKNVRREYIERYIALALQEAMLNDEAINALADAAVAYQDSCASNGDIDALRNQLSDVNRSIANIIKAIESGIFSAATQSRLAELEIQQRDLQRLIAVAEAESEDVLTREQIIATLELFKGGDINDKNYQEALIDTFLVAAYLYDDKIKFVFNLGGTTKDTTLPFDIDSIDPEAIPHTAPEFVYAPQTSTMKTP